MSKLDDDANYNSSDDEDYVPSAADTSKADAELAALLKDAQEKDSEEEEEHESSLPENILDFLNADENEKKESCSNNEDPRNPDNDDYVGRVQEFPHDIKATTIEPGRKYSVKTLSDYCGDMVETEKEMSKEELEELVSKAANPRKRKAVQVDGLNEVLKTLEPKKKLTVMAKTKLDWNKHVEKKGLEATLSAFQKGKKNVADHLSFTKNMR